MWLLLIFNFHTLALAQPPELPDVAPTTVVESSRSGFQPQIVRMCEGQAGSAAVLVCEAFNSFRRERGLNEEFLDSRLNKVAQAYAEKMARSGQFSHVDENGGPDQRVSSAGVRFSMVAENIAAGQRSVNEVLKGWKESPGHLKNMMEARITRQGVGYALAADGTPYWVHLFLRDPGD